MEIRLADKVADWPHIIAGATAFAGEVSFRDLLPPLGSEEFEAAVRRIVEWPPVDVLIALDGDRLLGGVGLAFMPYVWNPALTQAEELFFWSSRAAPMAALRLFRAALRHIEERGADVLAFHAMETSAPGVARLYQRAGLRLCQSTFMGVLRHA